MTTRNAQVLDLLTPEEQRENLLVCIDSCKGDIERLEQDLSLLRAELARYQKRLAALDTAPESGDSEEVT